MFELLLISMLVVSLKDIELESETKNKIIKSFREEIKNFEAFQNEPKTE